jgi:hypothetical protein
MRVEDAVCVEVFDDLLVDQPLAADQRDNAQDRDTDQIDPTSRLVGCGGTS